MARPMTRTDTMGDRWERLSIDVSFVVRRLAVGWVPTGLENTRGLAKPMGSHTALWPATAGTF